jgi:ABC-type transport system involved in multi-copper enzyme maturation permease subunit
MTKMLFYKAWLETRTRFFTAVAVTIAVCAFWTLAHTWIENNWHRDLLEHPNWNYQEWYRRAMRDYPFYLWHFVYAEMFQKIWVIFAVLLGIGGLSREAAHGTAGFTLSLPVGRFTLFRTRAAMALAELVLLCVIALTTIAAGSRVMGLAYPISHGISHITILMLGGMVFLAASLCLTEFMEGEHTSVLIGLGGVGLLYFMMQPYIDGAPLDWFAIPFAVPKLMAGPAEIMGIGDIAWSGMLASLTAAALFITLGLQRTQRRDY